MGKLKRITAPKHWRVPKKKYKWVVCPSPGPHRKFESIPLQIIVKEILHLAETSKEAKQIIKKGEILVDGKPRKDHDYPTGIFDVISIPKINKHYRIVPYEDGLKLIEIDESEAKLKICKIENKTAVKGGKIQLNLNDGKNILAEKKYKTGDSVLLEIPDLNIVDHIPLEEGNTGIIVKGKNAGKIVKVKKVIPSEFKVKPKVVCEFEGRELETLKDYIFIIGKDKPVIKVN